MLQFMAYQFRYEFKDTKNIVKSYIKSRGTKVSDVRVQIHVQMASSVITDKKKCACKMLRQITFFRVSQIWKQQTGILKVSNA